MQKKKTKNKQTKKNQKVILEMEESQSIRSKFSLEQQVHIF